jgi:hypothetical protein
MAPPEAPTLSAFPLSDGGPGGGAASPQKIGAIPKLVFQVEMLLDTLARAVPGAAQQVDQAKAIVRGILTKSIPSGGGTGTQSMASPGMGGGMGGPGGYTP